MASLFRLNVAAPLEAGGVVWSIQGALYATVIVKAAHRIADDGSLSPLPAEPIGPGDMCPFVDRAQLLVVTSFPRQGHGRAAVMRGDRVLADKYARHGSELAPRPLGGSFDPRRIEALPPNFDRNAFQAAPPDQQFDHVLPGDRIYLENLDASGRRMLQIPATTPVVTAQLDGASLAVPLRCDTVLFDERGLLTLLWRGPFRLPNEQAVARVAVDVVAPGAPAGAGAAASGFHASAAEAAVANARAVEATLGVEAASLPRAGTATPFAAKGIFARAARAGGRPVLPWKVGQGVTTVSPKQVESTMGFASGLELPPMPMPVIVPAAPPPPPQAPAALPALVRELNLPDQLDEVAAPESVAAPDVMMTAFQVSAFEAPPPAPLTPAALDIPAAAVPAAVKKTPTRAALLKNLRRK